MPTSPGNWISTALQLLWVLFLFAVVLFLAYLTTRVVARRYGAGGGSGRYLRVIDSAPLGQNRAVALIEVGGEVYCVGVTEHGVNLLGKHDRGELTELAPREAATGTQLPGADLSGLIGDFGTVARDTLARFKQSLPARKSGAKARQPEHDSAPETDAAPDSSEFAVRIRDQIARLRQLEGDEPPTREERERR
jgi:flagellar protein FliO/FliZ